jgi:hypothetical protein
VIIRIVTYERSTLVNREKYIGLESSNHQATIVVAVIDSGGKVIMESILETKAALSLQFFAGLRGTLSGTFEEGTWAAWLYDLLKVDKLPVGLQRIGLGDPHQCGIPLGRGPGTALEESAFHSGPAR